MDNRYIYINITTINAQKFVDIMIMVWYAIDKLERQKQLHTQTMSKELAPSIKNKH